MRYFLTILFLSLTLPAFAAPDETPVEAAKKFITAWYKGDIGTVIADSNPRHPFRKPDFDSAGMVANVRNTVKYIGPLEEILSPAVTSRGGEWKTVTFQLKFAKGTYEGGIHLTDKNQFTGMYGPYLESDITIPELDKKQMLADYDHMIEVLHDAMPHDLSIREGFGIDVWKQLDRYRAMITGNETAWEFAMLIAKALQSCKGHHLWLNNPAGYSDDEWFKKMYGDKISPETVKTNAGIQSLATNPGERLAPFQLDYWMGDYYTFGEFSLDGITYPARMKLTAVDGITPQTAEPAVRDRLAHFDIRKRRFFAPDFYTTLPSPEPDRRTYEFLAPDGKQVQLTVTDNTYIDMKRNRQSVYGIRKQVLHFKEHNLVYIRVPAMDPKEIPFYEKELIPILKKEKPRYAVIDIRGNGGGSDDVPYTLLSLLSANQLRNSGVLATPNNERVQEYIGRRGSSSAPVFRRIPFLENREFNVREFSGEIEKGEDATAEHIYVIAHDVYSSAGTLVAMAKASEHVTAVGFHGTRILGRGINPYLFALPNSKLIVSVEPAIDLFNCKTAADCLHLETEIDLPMSAEEYFTYHATPVPKDCREYLLTQDPFMRKIFELIAERNKK